MFPFFGVGETVRQMDFLQYLKDYGPLFLMGIVFSTPYPTALYKVFEKKMAGESGGDRGVRIKSLLYGSFYE